MLDELVKNVIVSILCVWKTCGFLYMRSGKLKSNRKECSFFFNVSNFEIEMKFFIFKMNNNPKLTNKNLIKFIKFFF